MKHQNVELIIADIDGTIVNDFHQMSERTKKCLERVHTEGILFGIASGRPIDFDSVDKFTNWHLSFPLDVIIGLNGGQIYVGKNKMFEETSVLKPEHIREIFKILEPYLDHFTVSVYRNKIMYCNRIDAKMKESSIRNNTVLELASLEEIAQHSCGKIMFRGEPEAVEETLAYVSKLPNDYYHFFKTQPSMMEAQDKFADKGKALCNYCKANGIDINNVWAFGDTTNDNGLLKAAGLGICLKNGSDDTKACADVITELTNNEDGVADFIEHNLLRSADM